MGTHWKLDEQDEKLRELVARAQSEGPQQIDEGGRGIAVVISLSEFERLRRGEGREGSLVEFFRRSPLVEVELDLERDRDAGEGRVVGAASRAKHRQEASRCRSSTPFLRQWLCTTGCRS